MKRVTTVINGQEVSIAFDENSIHIYNAFPIKDDLKQRGYRWNPADKSWFSKPTDVETELNRLKNNPKVPLPVKVATAKVESKSEITNLPQSLSVSDLRNRIDQLIREGIRGNIWVRGVIASDVKNYKWAAYLDLKDEDESRDIFFRMEIKKEYLETINRKLLDSGVSQGLEKDLPVFCNVDVHLPLRNVVDIRLSLLDILPEYTQSKIRNQREITLEKLTAEGIIENQKRLVLPALLTHVGLISSAQGTSVQDILAGLVPYESKYRFYFVDSRMEGSSAVDNIIGALEFLEVSSGVELEAIIIARGGGSEQSLAVFNDLRLCRRVCLTGIPIITAIGHEKDVSAIECCSWLTPTPATPSGVGKYLQHRYLNLQEQLSGRITQLIHRFTTGQRQEMEKIKSYLKNIPARVAGSVRLRQERLSTMARGLERALTFTVRDHERRIGAQTGQLWRRVGDIQLQHIKHVAVLVVTLQSRIRAKQARAVKEVEKTMGRLDFGKRQRDNQKQGDELYNRTRVLLNLAKKTIEYSRKDIQVRQQLVQAADPVQILKKGFTLTLDHGHRVIKSWHEFNSLDSASAILQFYDGSMEIAKYINSTPSQNIPGLDSEIVQEVYMKEEIKK